MGGTSTFDGAQMFFYQNCSSILEGRVISDAFATESLWSSLIYHQLTYGAKNHFWLTILKKVFGTTCSLPSYVYSSGKNSCAAGKLCLQHNWPEKLPKYLTQKGVVYQAIDFWGSESISVPQPGANEL